MITTSNLDAHRPTPRTNNAAHAAAQNERANRNARQDAAAIRYCIEHGQTWAFTHEGLRRSLQPFKLQGSATELTEGDILISAISQETGEIRKYRTHFKENIRFIGNSDFLLNNREHTLYLVYERTGYTATSWQEIDRREAGN